MRNEDVFVGDVPLGNCLGKSRNASIAERGRRRRPESFPVTSTTQKASPGRSAAPPSGNTNWSGLTLSFFLVFLLLLSSLFSLLYSFNHLRFFFNLFSRFLLSLLLVVILPLLKLPHQLTRLFYRCFPSHSFTMVDQKVALSKSAQCIALLLVVRNMVRLTYNSFSCHRRLGCSQPRIQGRCYHCCRDSLHVRFCRPQFEDRSGLH